MHYRSAIEISKVLLQQYTVNNDKGKSGICSGKDCGLIPLSKTVYINCASFAF